MIAFFKGCGKGRPERDLIPFSKSNYLPIKNALTREEPEFLLSWCPGQDLNLHAVRHMLLRHTCLPVPPPGPGDIIS